ncbi:STAS/SEC14 domain-containing protein [Gammaproteobacteria bacterium]|nr:STAS/SEC14 domain-containing protein [Gammaproteobacteria bacterium]
MNDGAEFVDLGTDDPNVIGLRVAGKATAETITQLVDRLRGVQASGHKARLYLNLANYEGYELPVVKEKLAHMGTFWSSIERCAYVVDSAWLTTAIGLVDAVTPMHLRAFSTDQDAEARAWILDKV